jgi:hypothetical protein
MRENPFEGEAVIPIKRYKPEQIVAVLRLLALGDMQHHDGAGFP